MMGRPRKKPLTDRQIMDLEANRFAMELLIPYDLIIEDLAEGFDLEDEKRVKELAKKYKVSVQCMAFRIGGLVIL